MGLSLTLFHVGKCRPPSRVLASSCAALHPARADCSLAAAEPGLLTVNLRQHQFPVPYLHERLPDSLKWRVLGALMKINQCPSAYTDRAHRAILGALGAMNLAAALGVREGREAIVANLVVEMVSDIEAIASGHP